MKGKVLYIIIAAVFLGPLALLFYIEWYWVFLIYNVFWAAVSYAGHSETKNPKISARNAFLIPLFFNLIGFGYVALKLNEDDETVEPKSNDKVEAAKSRLRQNILGDSTIQDKSKSSSVDNVIEGYPDWIDVYRGNNGFNIELKKAIQKNVNENQSELINMIENNNIIDSDNFWSHIEQSEILESFGLNKLFEDFSSDEYLKYAKTDEEAIEIEEKWQDEEYWIEMEFDAITIIDSKINELILNTQKFTEFKNSIKNTLDSKEDSEIIFKMFKWDTIEKQETYDEDWKGIKYTLSWDMRIKNAEFSFGESIKDFYEIIENFNSLDELKGDNFNLIPVSDDGADRENIKIIWGKELTDEENKQFIEYGGIEQLAQDSEKYDNIDVIKGRISKIEIIVGDKKYSTEDEEKKLKYNYEDVRELIEQLNEYKPKIKISASEYINGFWQFKNTEEVTDNESNYPAADEVSFDEYEKESQDSGGVGEEIEFDKNKKIYDNSYYINAEAWYDLDALIKNIKDYISDEPEDLTWDGFYFWAMDEANIELWRPDNIYNNRDVNCNLLSYNLGYPEGKNNIGWNEIYEVKSQDWNLEIITKYNDDVGNVKENSSSSIEIKEDYGTNGEIQTFYKSGKIETELFKDSSGKGYYKKYYESGQLEINHKYLNGMIEGVFETYFKNGNLYMKRNMIADKADGETIKYFENGNIESSSHFKNDLKNGIEKQYYENGNLCYQVECKDGLQNGKVISYDEDGNKVMESTMLNGNLEGNQIVWWANGKLKAERVMETNEIISEKIYDEKGIEIDNQKETKDEILNTKLKKRKILSHQILTKGEFYYMLENEIVSVFAQQHTLEKVIQEYEDDEWHTVDREFVDEFYLTDYEKGYKFEEVDLSKLIKIEESPDFESNGVSYDWCGIEEDDDNETRQKKWDDYKSKFPKATSIEHFDIENKKS